MTSRATTQIEEYMNTERHKVLLDVAKHLMTGLLPDPTWGQEVGEVAMARYARIAVTYAEALIKEVELR